MENAPRAAAHISYPFCEYHPQVQMVEIEERFPGVLQILFLAHLVNAGGQQELDDMGMPEEIKLFECPVCGHAGIYLPVRRLRSYAC